MKLGLSALDYQDIDIVNLCTFIIFDSGEKSHIEHEGHELKDANIL